MGCVILDPFNKLWKESREGRSRRDNNNFNHEDCMMNEYDTKLIKIIADRLSIPVCCMRRVGREIICVL